MYNIPVDKVSTKSATFAAVINVEKVSEFSMKISTMDWPFGTGEETAARSTTAVGSMMLYFSWLPPPLGLPFTRAAANQRRVTIVNISFDVW